MTNLLTFEPQTKPEVSAISEDPCFSDSLNQDLWFSCTPDLPALRYSGVIPVFIWDELKTYLGLQGAGITHDMMRVDQYLVTSKEKYLPFANKAEKKGCKYDMILPTSPEWTKGFKEKPFNSNTRKMSGRIVHLSLAAMQSLDRYYFNTAFHTRHKALFTSGQSNQTEISAWMYTVPTQNFTKYHPHEGTYSMLRGFEPAQCTSNDSQTYTSSHMKPT